MGEPPDEPDGGDKPPAPLPPSEPAKPTTTTPSRPSAKSSRAGQKAAVASQAPGSNGASTGESPSGPEKSQLNTIKVLAQQLGMSDEALEHAVKADFGRPLDQINRHEAVRPINTLVSLKNRAARQPS